MQRAALELQREAATLSFKDVRSLKGNIANAIRAQLGELDGLITKHGTLANALEATLASWIVSYNEVIRIFLAMDNFGEKIKTYATAAEVLKDFSLNVITRVQDNTQRGSKKALNKMQQIKQLLSSGTSLYVSPKLANPPLIQGCNGWLCLPHQSMQTHHWGQSALAVIPHLLPSTCYSP